MELPAALAPPVEPEGMADPGEEGTLLEEAVEMELPVSLEETQAPLAVEVRAVREVRAVQPTEAQFTIKALPLLNRFTSMEIM